MHDKPLTPEELYESFWNDLRSPMGAGSITVERITQYTAAIRQAARDEALDEAAKWCWNKEAQWSGGLEKSEKYFKACHDAIQNLKSQPAEKGD